MQKPSGVSFNTIALKVIGEAIKAAPRVNSHIKYNRLFAAGKVYVKDKVNIAMPMLLANGEMRTAAIMDVGSKTLGELQHHINEVREKASRETEIKARDVIHWAREHKECTITVSNIGALCKGLTGTFAMLEIIPPQVAAVGIGALNNGKLPLCVVFDHRALNFSDVLPFLTAIKEGFSQVVR